MVVKCTVVGAWVEGAVRNWFEEEEGGDGKRSEKCLIDFNYQRGANIAAGRRQGMVRG